MLPARPLEPFRRPGTPQAAPGRSRRRGPILAPSIVEQHRLIAAAAKANTAALARRVKALAADPGLKSRARFARVEWHSAASLVADVELRRSRLLSFSTFRKNVNPLFYRPAEDQQACANCHGNHTILRIAEADAGRGDGVEQLMINYNSALKVVNLGEPEASLILRKPRSPHGAGGADPASPTGLTHVGGPRWETTESPAYRAILDWIREASRLGLGSTEPETFSADSYSPGYEPALAGDGDLSTIWHTEFVGASPGYPHELVVDSGGLREVEGLLYVPRQDSPNGRVKDFQIRTSDDGRAWSEPSRRDAGATTRPSSMSRFPVRLARYVQLRGLSEVEGRPFMSAAELGVDASAPTGPPGAFGTGRE